MDFETLAVAKSYTNQQILNNDQENSDEPLVLNMLDYGVDVLKIGNQALPFTTVPLANAESLKEKIINRKNDQIVLNLESELSEDFKIIANCHILNADNIIQLYSKSTLYSKELLEFTFVILLDNNNNRCFVIIENVGKRLFTLPPYSDDTSADNGKFLRVVNSKAAWVSLDDVSEVGA